MKIVITGSKGMLGRTLCKTLSKQNEIIQADLPEVDITNITGFDKFIETHNPDIVIHCAAMTKVDDCETNVDLAFKINAAGTCNVASSCFRHNAKLIAISTDYVFDGQKTSPYTEYDTPCPKTVYGSSKFAGEELIRKHCPNHLILRIAWLYGAGGPSFVHTMINLADGTRPELKVVFDQFGNPTSTLAVARKIKDFIRLPSLVGTFHITCEGTTNWYEFTKEIFRLTNNPQKVSPCTTENYPRPAPRPTNSSLDKMNLRIFGLGKMPTWQEALEEFVQQEFNK